MADDTTNEIQQKIDALPPEVKSYLYSKEMSDAVQQIGTKYQLHIDQVGALESEIAAAIIGITQLNELGDNIADSLDIDKGKGNLIAKDASGQIFAKVRNTMKMNTLTPKPPVVQAAPEPKPTPPTASQPAMPSEPPPAPKPVPPLPPAAPTPAPAPKPVPPPAPTIPKADTMLSQPTVSMAPKPAPDPAPAAPAPTSMMPSSAPDPASAPSTKPAEVPKPAIPPAPQNYKVDPYREPIEP